VAPSTATSSAAPPAPVVVPATPALRGALTSRRRAQTRIRWELLQQLVRKDLKVKYQGSVLGFAWSLANPLILLAIYSFVFGVVLKNNIPRFPIYLMSGLLVWTAFSGSVMAATGSVVGNANLVKKVRFPLLVLPLSSVGFAGVHFVLQLLVLFVVIVASGHFVVGLNLLLLMPALAVLVLLSVAFGIVVAAVNVRYRDTQHFIEVALAAWFWLNPVVYAAGLIKGRLDAHGLFWLYFANPMTSVIASFQRALYVVPTAVNPATKAPEEILIGGGYGIYLLTLAVSAALGLLLLVVGVRIFRSLQADFAEEL
jgi:ABC-2 type transport system permease protein